MEYSYLDVFRPGFLSNVWSLGQIGYCMAELQQLLFPWRDIEICDAAKDTPISENSSSSQFNITKAFGLNWPKYYVDVIKSLGGVSYRVNMSLPVASRWRYDYNWIWSLRSLQVRIRIKHVEFGVDRT